MGAGNGKPPPRRARRSHPATPEVRLAVAACRSLGTSNQASREDRPDALEADENADWFNRYALRFLRSIRSVLAPKGISNSTPSISAVGFLVSGCFLGRKLAGSLS